MSANEDRMMLENRPILEVRRLTKRFPEFSLKEISFSLPRGYIMGFIGPNGAGKTTTIKLILNLLKADGGEINVFGLDYRRHGIEIRDRIGVVYDECRFYQELTIAENARFISALYRHWDEKTFQTYLKRFGLSPKRRVKELSKGMKMKFALAVALSHRAELLIMDEPTSGLDPLVRSELLETLGELIQDERCSVFFSTHITSDLEKIADYITFIQDGEIVFSESKEKIFENYALVKGKKELLSPEVRRHLIGLKETAFGFEGLTADPECFSGEARERLVLEKPTLEEILVYTVRGKKNAQFNL